MHALKTKTWWGIVLVVVVGFSARPAMSQTPETTTPSGVALPSGVAIPLDELGLRLRPLTKAELEVEAQAWLAVLQEKSRAIALAEISVKQQNAEIQQVKEIAEEVESQQNEKAAAGDATATDITPAVQAVAEQELESKKDAKATTLEGIVKLREQRSRIIDRTNLVLDELESKGGDASEYRMYVQTVAGITIDVSDTDATWQAVIGWLRSEEGGLRWAKNIAWFIATILAFWIIGRIVSKAVRKALSLSKNLSDLLRDFLVKSTRRATMLIGLIVALAQLEVNIGPLMAAIGAAGFVVAFALQGTLSNFASGLLILIYRPYDVGDVVDVAGVCGSVKSMSLLSTTISTFDNQTVIVPNNSIWGGTITNVTGNDTRRVDMVFGIGYADDGEKARKIIEDVLASHELVLSDPPPVVRLHELADSSVNFICRPWSKTTDYWAVYWDVTKTVKDRFDAEGINIPFPQRDVHVYQAQPVT